MSLEILPLKCKECARSSEVRYHSKCDTCRKIEFEESVFCELNRAVQVLDDPEKYQKEIELRYLNKERASAVRVLINENMLPEAEILLEKNVSLNCLSGLYNYFM